ncbi:hypothetical protein ACIQJ4_29740 [Streptomyces filamentosus]|uniref:hypothetical protein n=1 Tax=Streptomyces filamentosus TaxID=67294 RepID=UPI0038250A7F
MTNRTVVTTGAGAESPLLVRARRSQGWGLGLLAAAGLLWVWFAVLLVTPYGEESGDCAALIAREYDPADPCTELRDWPFMTALLGGSVPLAAVGSAVYASGSAARRVAEHLDTAPRA